MENRSFADQFRLAVKASGHSVRTLARLADLDVAQISKLINGHRFLNEIAMNRLAKALKLQVTVKKGKGE